MSLIGLNIYDPVTRITACEFFCVWITDLTILYRLYKGKSLVLKISRVECRWNVTQSANFTMGLLNVN